MTPQTDQFDVRPSPRRFPLATAIVAGCMTLAGSALSACEGSNEPTTDLSDASVATYAVGIDGMHCESCVKAITAKIVKVDGVRSCTVDLDAESATIDAVPEAMPTVREAIARLGFKVRDPDSPSRSAEDVEIESNTISDADPTDA